MLNIFDEQNMATLLGSKFSTGEKAVAQVDLKLLGSNVELIVVELDQEKFGQLLSSGSISLKAMRKYRKISSETRSLTLSEASQRKTSSEVNHMLFNKASGSYSLEARATSFGANTFRDEVSQETRKTSVLAQGQHHGRDQSRRQACLKAQLSEQDASLVVHFYTERAQFTRGSQ